MVSVTAHRGRPRVPGRRGKGLTSVLMALMRKFRGRNTRNAKPGVSTARPETIADDCIFCRRHDPAINQIMRENASFFARYDNFPANEGHLEIVPKRHVESFFDLSRQEVIEAYELLVAARDELHARHHPDGYTIGVNEGQAAGRSVDHLHIHLIPRYYGDVKDPRGGIRRAAPNCDPDEWVTSTASNAAE